MLRDELTESKAGKVGYLCGVLLKAIEIGELEQRLAKLEYKISEGNNNGEFKRTDRAVGAKPERAS